MEVRKLQKTGGSSLILTLPKKWVDEIGLKDKDTVKIVSQNSGTLSVYPTNFKQHILKSSLVITNLTNMMITRELIAHYISGVDEISIISKQLTPEQRKEIRKLFQLLIGFEIIDESSTKMLVKNVFDATKFPIPQSIEKMFHITTSMIVDAYQAFFTQNILLAKDVIDRDFEVDKLYLTITRQLHVLTRNKISEEEVQLHPGDLYYYEDIATQLERIADHAVNVATVGSFEYKQERTDSFASSQKLVKEIVSLIQQAEEMVEKEDNILAHTILNISENIGKVLSPYERLDQKISQMQLLIEGSLDRIRRYIMNMAEITIDQHVSSGM